MRPGSRERRQRVLEAAASVLRERGLADTRISDVGKLIGMSPGHVMYYFESRDDLLLEAVRWAEDDYYSGIEASLEAIADPRRRLVRMIELWCPTARAEQADVAWSLWPELWARSMHHAGLASLREELESRWEAFVMAIVREGQRADAFADLDARRFVQMLGALIDGLSLRVLSGDPAMSPATMRKHCVAFAADQLDFKA